jgi:hypothetical protein
VNRRSAGTVHGLSASDGICGPYHSPAEKAKIFQGIA